MAAPDHDTSYVLQYNYTYLYQIFIYLLKNSIIYAFWNKVDKQSNFHNIPYLTFYGWHNEHDEANVHMNRKHNL